MLAISKLNTYLWMDRTIFAPQKKSDVKGFPIPSGLLVSSVILVLSLLSVYHSEDILSGKLYTALSIFSCLNMLRLAGEESRA